ncbi:hypothetical protein H4R33_006561 [Dimargaris cristalligena]|nr:hypothetical protein H4R33_006561 [Dimargaris cristalligena]
MAYTDAHRLFLQNCLLERCLPQSKAEQIFQKCLSATSSDQTKRNFQDALLTVNVALDPINLELRTIQDEISGERMVAIVNTKGDDIAQMATSYSASELNAFKHLIKLIMTADDGNFCVASTATINDIYHLGTHGSKLLVQEFLKDLVRSQWLDLSAAGYYSLSNRSIVDLQTYLKEEYIECISECFLCKEIVTKGERCPREDCGTALHVYCARKYIPVHRNQCPSCHTSWVESQVFGSQTFDGTQLRQSRIEVSRQRRQTSASTPDSNREEGEEVEVDEEEARDEEE